MALPKAIELEAQRAEAFFNQAAQQAPQNVVSDPAQLTAPAPAEPPPPPAPEPAPPQPSEETWEKKFKTLKGMYDTQVPQLQRRMQDVERDSQRKLQEMEQRLQKLLEKKEKPEPKQEPQVDKRDVDTFGADMMDMVQRYLTQFSRSLDATFQSRAAALEERIDALEANLTGVSRRTSESIETQFYALLTKLVPDWEEINDSDEWKLWLDGRDPIYGARLQDALNSAFNQNDAQRVAKIFDSFKSSRPVPKQPESLASQVAPTTVAAPTPPSQPAPRPLLSEKFVKTFFTDLALGKYAKRPEEAVRIEAEINAAAAENRIVR